MKAKVISATSDEALQDRINDFLYSISSYEVTFITQSAVSNNFITVIIFYKRPNEDPGYFKE